MMISGCISTYKPEPVTVYLVSQANVIPPFPHHLVRLPSYRQDILSRVELQDGETVF